jgi:hypothetical protein
MPDDALESVNIAGQYGLETLRKFFIEDPHSIEAGLDKGAQQITLFLITMLNGTASMAKGGSS